jgi:hypothetical protein
MLVTADSACTARPAGCARGGHDDLRPRREVRTQHEDPTIVTLSATAKALAPPDERAGGPKLDGHGRHGGHGEAEGDAVAAVTAVAAPTVVASPPRARDEGSPSHGGRGRRGDHGGHSARDAGPNDHGGHGGHGEVVAAERATRRSRVTARHGGHCGHGVSRRPSGWAIPSAGSPAEAGQRRTTISHKAAGREKSRSEERVAVNSTGGEAAMKSLASSEKEEVERHATDEPPRRFRP